MYMVEGVVSCSLFRWTSLTLANFISISHIATAASKSWKKKASHFVLVPVEQYKPNISSTFQEYKILLPIALTEAHSSHECWATSNE